MRSTMQDVQLTIGMITRHGTTVHRDSEVVTATADGTRSMSYAELGTRVAQLAGALRALGIDGDQRVGTFMWNNAEHLEAYLAVPSMGAVLHTLNIRLPADQLVYIANHAEDRVVVVDGSLVPLLAPHLGEMTTVEHVLVAGPEAAAADLDALRASGKQVHLYDELLAAQPGSFDWPELDERDAAAMCYTSGTTGNPKGVVYSHRSAYLHSMAIWTGTVAGLDAHYRVLPIVPQFHANAWGLVYAALMSGASLCMPDRWLQAEPLCRFMAASQPTVSGAVPTVWNDVLGYLDAHPEAKPESLGLILCGGSAVPLSLQQGLWRKHGIEVRQAWGMTETSPVASAGRPPLGVAEETDEAWHYRGTQGRLLCGVEGRIVSDDGEVMATDGAAVGRAGGPGAVGHRRLLRVRRPRGGREVPRRLAAHRRRRQARRPRLHHAHRPLQGRHQVRRRVDQLGRPRERADGARGRRRGRGGRRSPTRGGTSARSPRSWSARAPR